MRRSVIAIACTLLLAGCLVTDDAPGGGTSSTGSTVVSSASPAPSLAELERNGVMMLDGKMLEVKNGQAMLMRTPKTMSGGMSVTVSGAVTLPDGRRAMLADGEMLTSGGMISVDGALVTAEAWMTTKQAVSPFTPETGASGSGVTK